jgi:hypothetical protein
MNLFKWLITLSVSALAAVVVLIGLLITGVFNIVMFILAIPIGVAVLVGVAVKSALTNEDK